MPRPCTQKIIKQPVEIIEAAGKGLQADVS